MPKFVLSRCRTLLPPNFFTPQGGRSTLWKRVGGERHLGKRSGTGMDDEGVSLTAGGSSEAKGRRHWQRRPCFVRRTMLGRCGAKTFVRRTMSCVRIKNAPPRSAPPRRALVACGLYLHPTRRPLRRSTAFCWSWAY